MNSHAPNFPRDSSFTTRDRKMRALAAFRTARIAANLPIETEVRQSSLGAEQNLQTKLGTCTCACNPSATCTTE
jgi:hypothetical protein